MLTKINEELTIASVALQRDRNIHCITTQQMCKSILFMLNNLSDNGTHVWDTNHHHSQKIIISRIKALELAGVIKLNSSEISILDNLYEYYN